MKFFFLWKIRLVFVVDSVSITYEANHGADEQEIYDILRFSEEFIVVASIKFLLVLLLFEPILFTIKFPPKNHKNY